MTTLGLFPLRIVLFPGAYYPLHVFEDRYKTLVHKCLADGVEFGINLVDEGTMYAIGCKARVARVITAYDDGRIDIVVIGTSRFNARSYDAHTHPYLSAQVDAYEDSDPLPDPDLLEETIGAYNRVMEMVYGEVESPLDPTEWVAGGAAFRMAQKSGLDLVTRQKLLTMQGESERLSLLLGYFLDIEPKIVRAEMLQAIVRNNGYVQPDDAP